MTNEPDTTGSMRPDPVDARLATLQRTVKRLAWMLALVFMIALLALLKTLDSRIRKTEYVLLDSQGLPRAVLGTRNDTPFLSMFDKEGHARIVLHIDQNGPMLRLSDTESTTHAGIWVQADGGKLALLNAGGSGLRLHADRHNARIHFQDNHGWPRLGLGLDDSAPFLSFMDTNLMARIVMGTDASGGKLSFFDDHNLRRLSLGVHANRPFLNPVTNPSEIPRLRQ